jgi:hypothetical protein
MQTKAMTKACILIHNNQSFLSSLNCPGPWKMPDHGILDQGRKTCTSTCEI